MAIEMSVSAGLLCTRRIRQSHKSERSSSSRLWDSKLQIDKFRNEIPRVCADIQPLIGWDLVIGWVYGHFIERWMLSYLSQFSSFGNRRTFPEQWGFTILSRSHGCHTICELSILSLICESPYLSARRWQLESVTWSAVPSGHYFQSHLDASYYSHEVYSPFRLITCHSRSDRNGVNISHFDISHQCPIGNTDLTYECPTVCGIDRKETICPGTKVRKIFRMKFDFLVDFDQLARNPPHIDGLHKTNEPGKSTSGLITVIFMEL